jgi:uncharacterized protein YdeI (YjbR/CyaY-like superfamily)
MKKTHSVEEYIQESKFREALRVLRKLILSTGLNESLKWNAPVYDLDGKNILGLGAFKNHFGIWFFNGALLNDKKGLLVNAQEKTKAMRQMRFELASDINTKAVIAYINEAIENQKLGKEIKPEKTKTIIIPESLKQALKTQKQLQSCFNALSPFKQKEYCEYIATAKREATVENRLQKISPMILKGIGLNDKYKNC